MKYLLLILIFVSCNSTSSTRQQENTSSQLTVTPNQTSVFDLLSKYSYQILGFCNYKVQSKINPGTGFFIKRNGKTFLVTAGHVFKGCNNLVKWPCQPDTFSVYAVQGTKASKICDVDARKAKLLPCAQKYLVPDIYVTEVSPNQSVNYIDSFIKPIVKENFSQIKIFGFPSIENMDENKDFHFQLAKEITIDSYSNINLDYNEQRIHDTMDYHIVNPNNAAEIASGVLEGASGSPVFIKDKILNQWKFLGVYVAGGRMTGRVLLVRPSRVDQEINRLLYKK